jgi:hypothetical protein
MTKLASFNLLIVALLAGACSSTKQISNYMIDESEARVLPVSTLNLPIKISKEGLSEQLNTVLGDTLYTDDNVDGSGLKVTAKKAEAFELDITQEDLVYTVPLKVNIEKKYYVTTLKAEGSISMQFKTSYEIDSTWNLITKTEVLNHKWTEKPTLRMGGFKLPFEVIANAVIKGTKNYLTSTIDQEVSNNLDLKHQAETMWEELYKPFLASEEYNTWMILNPLSVSVKPIRNDIDTISTLLQVEAQPHVILGEKPDSLPSTPLHAFNWLEDEKDHFDITLVSELPYSEAKVLAGDNLIGEKFESGKRFVIVEDIDMYARGQFLIIKTKLSGSYNGWINLAGRPRIDEETKQIVLDNFNIELDTKNVLHKSAAWLFKGSFKKIVKQEIEENLSYYMNYTKEVLQEELNHVKVQDGIYMDGNLHDLKITNLYLTDQALKTWIGLEGNIKLDIIKEEEQKDEELGSK